MRIASIVVSVLAFTILIITAQAYDLQWIVGALGGDITIGVSFAIVTVWSLLFGGSR